MPFLAETEIKHPQLGSIVFDDGKCDPSFAGVPVSDPKWVCRPDGWDSDFEIYIPDEDGAPGDLNRATEALERRDKINSEGRSLGEGNIGLA
jgi:hypothetical protein